MLEQPGAATFGLTGHRPEGHCSSILLADCLSSRPAARNLSIFLKSEQANVFFSPEGDAGKLGADALPIGSPTESGRRSKPRRSAGRKIRIAPLPWPGYNANARAKRIHALLLCRLVKEMSGFWTTAGWLALAISAFNLLMLSETKLM